VPPDRRSEGLVMMRSVRENTTLAALDLPEILHLAHRVYVMYRGTLRAELTGEAINQETVVGHFFAREAA
jgi:ABC-type sugar transport system ATPase subunit